MWASTYLRISNCQLNPLIAFTCTAKRPPRHRVHQHRRGESEVVREFGAVGAPTVTAPNELLSGNHP
jgi:hypothetical protein